MRKRLRKMIRQGGLSLPELFNRVRLRVNEITKGAEVPWNAQHIQTGCQPSAVSARSSQSTVCSSGQSAAASLVGQEVRGAERQAGLRVTIRPETSSMPTFGRGTAITECV
jgi:uncharacterized caspase-like protein